MDDTGAVSIGELVEERRQLLDVASWMLGGTGEAEAVVGAAYRRWYGLSDAARAEIPVPRRWLTRTVARLCLGRPAFPGLDGVDSVDNAFGTAPGADADIAGRGERECAELADRARRSLRLRRARPTSAAEHDALARAVCRACAGGDAELLASLLCGDVTAFFDGGGKVRVPARPVHGSERVARGLLTLLAGRSRTTRSHTTLAAHSVNGATGLVARYDHEVVAVVSLDIADHRVAQVWAVLNPDKLRPWNQPPPHGAPGSRRNPSPGGDG
ncbi:RNA polymerase subunit sigma [Streptomyces sp. NPDC002643]